MAITITRTLTNLTGVFNQNSIEFNVPTGTEGVKVTIAAIDFIPVKTDTDITVNSVANRDVYVMDLTDILKYVLGFPPADFLTASLLFSTQVITIAATGETSATITTNLSFITHAIGEYRTTIITGRSQTVYHYGYLFFYNSSTAGDYVGSIAGINYTYTLVAGWNFLQLHSTHFINGTLTFGALGIGAVSFPVVYLTNPLSYDKIVWLNRDGCWSEIAMRKITTNNAVSRTNTIPLYKETHAEIQAKTLNVSAQKITSVSYDCIARDLTQWNLLIQIADAPIILVDDAASLSKIYRIKSISQDSAECRQNLHFTLTLEIEDYVASY